VDVVDADVQVLPEGWQVRVAATGARVDRREGGSGAAAETHAGFGLAVLRSWKNITDEWDKSHGRQFETVPDENRHLQNALDNFTSFWQQQFTWMWEARERRNLDKAGIEMFAYVVLIIIEMILPSGWKTSPLFCLVTCRLPSIIPATAFTSHGSNINNKPATSISDPASRPFYLKNKHISHHQLVDPDKLMSFTIF
jgi:hypothetical protein